MRHIPALPAASLSVALAFAHSSCTPWPEQHERPDRITYQSPTTTPTDPAANPGPAGPPAPEPTTEPTPTGPTTAPGYPVARPSSKPNHVISPFAPYNVIDVTGFKSGDLARDPGNMQIFRVP